MTIRWGILSTGRIAGVFGKALNQSRTGKLVAVASRSQESADKFGQDFLGERKIARHASYEALLANPDVDAVYIAMPHPWHAEWAVRCMEAGKHVLVEKPIGINYAEAMVIFEAAARLKRFCMEAFMYRSHPLVAKLVELVRSGAIGDVRAISSNFAFNVGSDYVTGRLRNPELGGGAILDVGCYPVSMCRLLAGAAAGQSVDPIEVKAVGKIGTTKVDDYTFALLKFPGDIIASCGTGVQVGMDNQTRVQGSKGSIVMSQWVPLETGNKLIVTRDGKTEEILADSLDGGDPVNAYTAEADAAARSIAAGRLEAEFPAMTWADSLGNMKTLDKWRAEIGLAYDLEKPERFTRPVHGRKLAKRADSIMEYGKLAGLDKPVARLVMGVDKWDIMRLSHYAHAAVMLDDYFERGGNAFDTAYIYGGGECEQVLGRWVESRGVREQVVILDKGAHTPNCNPQAMSEQLAIQLDRLRTSYLDIYMMHRDNLEIPVGEFVHWLNDQHKAGRVRVFGLSNWTQARLDEFAAYAKAKGLMSFAAVSNNFSLARMVDAVWAGCLAASEPEFKKWHEKTKTPLMPWSSQARGFFTRADPQFTADAELTRCWYAPDNFQRLARARELATEKGVTPIQIALAYVLRQDFPTFPLIGPMSIAETASSFEALRVKLSRDEVRWLNLESATR